jgi:hypothetical protein
MRIIAFLPDYNDKHAELLSLLASGIPGAETRPLGKYVRCDVAIIFGLVKKSYAPTLAKAEILKRHSGRSLIVMESAFFNRGQYWAIGWGGIHGGADFRPEGVDGLRWETMNVRTSPWRRKPGPVVVCGQLPRDTNVQDTDHVGWCQQAVKFYQRLGVEVLFRPHPRIEDPAVYGIDPGLFDPSPKIAATLDHAGAVVTWNSTSGVDAALAGVPVICCSPDAMARPVASHELVHPDEIRCPSRKAWLAGLAHAQWTRWEMREGLPWKHLTRP